MGVNEMKLVRTEPVPTLLIFDFDGVLIDSEIVSCRVELEELSKIGCVVEPREYLEVSLGRTEEELIWAELAERAGVQLPTGFVEDTRAKVKRVFQTELRTIPWVESVLETIDYEVCVASGSRPERLHHNLAMTGLDRFFDGNVFSATQVPRGKPFPDLFLHAAEEMGCLPSNCIVVEDSVAGLKAGRAAGMTTLGFVGGGHCRLIDWEERLREEGCFRIFNDMRELPRLCREILSNRAS